jgi:hypothetical protein
MRLIVNIAGDSAGTLNFWDKEKIQLLDNKLESMISRDENPYSFVENILS